MKDTSSNPVTLLSASEVLSRRHLPSMLMLALGAGAVNAGAFAVCDRFVTHVTGNATRIGVDLGQWLLMFEYSLVLAAFIAGAMSSVVVLQARALRGQRPLHFVPVLGAVVALLVVTVLGTTETLGSVGGPTEETADFLFLSVLAFGMGLLNAGVASSTALSVRTTHMTGPATDLGVHLGLALLGQGEARRQALELATLRGGKLVSFIAGAALMFPLVEALGFVAFLVPAALLSIAALRSFVPLSSAQPATAVAT